MNLSGAMVYDGALRHVSRTVLILCLISVWILPSWARSRNACEPPLDLKGYQAFDYGQVSGQWLIDPTRAVWGRLNYTEKSRLIEIERLWGLGSKTVWPEVGHLEQYQGALLTLSLRSPTVFAVDIWQFGWLDTDGAFHDIVDARFFVDGIEVQSPDGGLQIPRVESGAQRTLKIVFARAIPASRFSALHFNGRTVFQNPLALKNILTGTRVDACAFFF